MSKELRIEAANRLARTIDAMPEDKRLAYCIVALSVLAANRPEYLLATLDIADMKIADGRTDRPDLSIVPRAARLTPDTEGETDE